MRRTRQPRTRTTREPYQASKVESINSRVYSTGGLDINTNLGEGYGPWRMPGESELLPFVTSANIACGAHAGDPVLMEAALEEARYNGLALGAHIGYPDLAGFGRREMHLHAGELRSHVIYQLGALAGVAKTLGFEITQVRPHGFLYRQMSHDVRIAITVAKAIADFDRWLVLIGPSGSNLQTASEKAGIRVAGEVLVDRLYDGNGNLVQHAHPRAVLKDPRAILNQAANLIRNRSITAADGTTVKMDFQTIHVHPQMVEATYVAEQVRLMISDACPLTSEPYAIDQEYYPSSSVSWAD